VAAPHSSFLDVFVYYVLGLPAVVSRADNAKIPFIGRLVRSVQPIFTDRTDQKNKSNTIKEIIRRSSPTSEWPQVLIFPEGTTTNGSSLITFKPGAFIPGLAVQPVCVNFCNRLDTVRWTWEGPSAYKVVFYTLCQFNNNLEITYLPVYSPNEEEKLDPQLFARNVREKMSDELQVLTTNHTYEDCRLMLKAREYNLPFESGLIEFEKIKEKLNINYENCNEILKKFADITRKNGTGKITLKEFSEYLHLPAKGPVEEIFSMYDRNKDDQIDFREFLIGLSLLSRPANTEETLKLAFNIFDNSEDANNKKGYITLSDLQSILNSAFSMTPEEVEKLFKEINVKNDNKISYDELKAYANSKPEYARIFLMLNEIKILNSNVELNKLANEKSATDLSTDFEQKPVDDSILISRSLSNMSTESTLTKRPVQPSESANDLVIEDLNDLADDHKND
jgi:lysophosphatidylcholine acyltransferase/lyso-PAF acetyltransferase